MAHCSRACTLTLLKTGELVQDIKVGDVVGIKWVNGTCMSCEFCKDSPTLADYGVSSVLFDKKKTFLTIHLSTRHACR